MRAHVVPDKWQRVASLLPLGPEGRRRHPGRRRVSDRAALAGVLYVLRTDVGWLTFPLRPSVAPGDTLASAAGLD
ncbi:transposase [Streptomyces tanashiensis]